MTVTSIYSKRRKAPPDVYTYDEIHAPLRAQVVHVLRDLFGFVGKYDYNGCLKTFEEIHDLLCREYGAFELSPNNPFKADAKVVDFVVNHADHEQVLDVIEVSLRMAARRVMSNYYGPQLSQEAVDNAVAEINTRFRERGVGYQYESGEIIRIDSQLLHSEAVKPALALLSAKEYAGANEEFLKAFEHYRKGDSKECLNECLKAFESTMKAICAKREWPFKATDAAKDLIDVCLKNGLIPTLIQSHIGGVRAALESAIPTIRNRMSGHGQGAKVVDVPSHYASYMLHLTATTIKFLAESEKALP
ncbi:MAG: hypothetical protein WAU58_02465 [Terriglobales bacterium]